MKFAGVILAAGYSSRMGAFKPLLQLGEKSCLGHCISLFHQASISTVYVITGHKSSQTAAEAKRLEACTVFNPNYDQGMFSSVCVGLSHLEEVDGVLILPVDIPMVCPATVKLLTSQFDGKTVLYPTCNNRRGHPPLIPACYIPQILQHNGRMGLKGILQHLPGRNVNVTDIGVCMDMDNEQDYIRMKELYFQRCQT